MLASNLPQSAEASVIEDEDEAEYENGSELTDRVHTKLLSRKQSLIAWFIEKNRLVMEKGRNSLPRKAILISSYAQQMIHTACRCGVRF